MKNSNVPQCSTKLNFTLLLANGSAINQSTVIRRNGEQIFITSELEIAQLIKKDWCKATQSKSFTDWANELNASGEYEGTFTKYDALDNLASTYTLNISGKYVNLYDFILLHIPFKN